MKKVVNFRSFVYSMIMLMLTSLSCLLIENLRALGSCLLVLIIFAPAIAVILLRKRLETYKIATVIVTSILCFVSFVSFSVRIFTWVPSEIDSRVYAVSGSVEDNYVVDGARKVILKNLYLDGTKVDGKMQLSINDEEKFFELIPVGDKLEFSAYVYVRELNSGYRVNASYLRSDVRFSATVNASKVAIDKGEANVMDKVNAFVKSTLIQSMGNEYGVIAYAMLSGDKNEVSSEVRDAFSASGIAHLLAVSGLHIGFLMAIVTFIMRKFKAKRLPTFIVDAVVLLLYSIFAGFSPSVLRASIMFLVGGGAMLLGEEKDGFNALGLAATGILTFNPLMLYEAGFLMSVGAVFGLIIFIPIFTRFLTKIKLPKRVAQALSAPVAAQLGILPVCTYVFGTIQLYSIFINILLIPVMSVAFMAVFVSLILAIIPPLKFALTASGFLIKGLTIAADFCASLPLAQVAIRSSLVSFAIYPLYFVISGYFNCKRKALVGWISAAIVVVIIVLLLFI